LLSNHIDSEVIAALMKKQQGRPCREHFARDAAAQGQLCARPLDQDQISVARSQGMRPIALGSLERIYRRLGICAFDTIGAEFMRDYEQA
jgi:glutamine phosphoribosylpyrophosphate amidotransferase